MSFDTVYAALYNDFSGADYDGWISFLKSAMKFSDIECRVLLDLGCGTGNLAKRCAKSGFDVIAMDISEEMLTQATSVNYHKNILYTKQDMRSFALYGGVQAAFCAYDGLNYLRGNAELEAVFSRLAEYIDDGGIFVFDINTPHRFEKIYADNAFVFENDDAMLVWANDYNKKSKKNYMALTVFKETATGKYERFDRLDVQRCFSLKTVTKILEKCGFCVVRVCGDVDFKNAAPDDEKYFIIAKKTGKSKTDDPKRLV